MAEDDDKTREDEDRDAIVRRRNRFVAIALASVAAQGCYDSHVAGEADTGSVTRDAGRDNTGPAPCLGAPFVPDAGSDAGIDTGGPRPCLEAPFDAGADSGADAGIDTGAPMPCLDVPRDAGTENG